jgi:hypothetical protein
MQGYVIGSYNNTLFAGMKLVLTLGKLQTDCNEFKKRD